MLIRNNLPRFEYKNPSDMDEVVAILKRHGEEARLLLGGTDLFNQMCYRLAVPEVLVDLKQLPGIHNIELDKDGILKIGAGATMNQISAHPDIQSSFPLLVNAADSVATYQLRNRATIGGNLCNASPCADGSTAIHALEGLVLLYSENGEREVPINLFHLGPGNTCLNPGEFLISVNIPKPPSGSIGYYRKLARSKIADIAIVSVALLGFPDPSTYSGYGYRLSLGSVGPGIIRAHEVESFLSDHEPNISTWKKAAEMAREIASPIKDIRAGVAYQQSMVKNLVYQGLETICTELKLNKA